MDPKTTLIATLGGQPQKVTFMLDLLLALGEEIDQVAVIYISSYERTRNAIGLLEAEFSAGKYGDCPCQLNRFPLKSTHSDLSDIRTPEEVEAVRQNITRLLSLLKEQERCVHLGLSGGRELMSLVALAAAMQYLTPADRIWHIYVPSEFDEQSRDGTIMHAPLQTGVQLIAVPFVPWVSYFPGLANLLKRSPQEMGEASYGWLNEAERTRCQRVWDILTPRQREVLQVFAAGLSRQEAAERLSISVATVDSHRESILAQCRLVWEAQAGGEFNVRFLQQYFGPFLSGLKQG
jgi:CRISPR-associated protein Csx14